MKLKVKSFKKLKNILILPFWTMAYRNALLKFIKRRYKQKPKVYYDKFCPDTHCFRFTKTGKMRTLKLSLDNKRYERPPIP